MSDEQQQGSQALDGALRELAFHDAAAAALQAPPAVEAAVMAAFRRKQAQRRRTRLFLAAAALVIGVSTALLWPEKPVTPAAAATTQPVESQPTEIATDYFPLRAGPVLDAGELGHVIRVPASPTMLARFGMSQATTMGTVSVSADVLVGFDGTARAVRFVR